MKKWILITGALLIVALACFGLYFWAVWGSIFLFFIYLGCDNKQQEKVGLVITEENRDREEWLWEQIYKTQESWRNGIIALSMGVMTAVVVYAVSGDYQKSELNCPMIILGLSALANLFWSTVLPLVENFSISWEIQRHHKLNCFFKRIINKLTPYWHILPLSLLVLQCIVISYGIVVALNE